MRPEIQDMLYGEELSLFEAFGLFMGVIFLIATTLGILLMLWLMLCEAFKPLLSPIMRMIDRKLDNRRQKKKRQAKEQYDKRWREALNHPPDIENRKD